MARSGDNCCKMNRGSRIGRVSQPVLPLLPVQARSVGPSAGLLEGPDGGVVFVFGLASFNYASDDQVGRRLAAVQLVTTKIASVAEVASAFGVNPATLWRWTTAFGSDGVLGLVAERPGPRRASKLTEALVARIVCLNASGLTLRQIATQAGVAPATVRVALGRVGSRGQAAAEKLPAGDEDVIDVEVCDDGLVIAVEGGVARVAEMVVLAAPVPRTAERVAARFGDLLEAPVVITEGAQLPLAGLLLALPALEMTGLLEVAAEVLPPMSRGFYGMRVTLLMGVFMALVREPRAEGSTRLRPADLGRLLGLDRAPEVKTLRRKLAELAGHGKGAQLQAALGRHHASTRPDAVGLLYLDGHVRVYSGTRQLPKTHIARMRIAGPATEETWVGDSEGDPVMVITAAPSQSLAAELHRLLPDLRALVGPQRRCTVVFDRGGYSPQVFTEIITAGFDLLTYFKGSWARSAVEDFTTVDFAAPDGTIHSYQLAERPIALPVPGQRATATGTVTTDATAASTLTLRLIVRRSPDGHQTPILTNRTDLSAAELAYRMAARWRQENYFKYAREHFCLDALDSYADSPDDLDRLVPNPVKARAINQVARARTDLITAHAEVAHALDVAVTKAGRRGNGGTATVDPAAGLAVNAAQLELAAAKNVSRNTETHLPLSKVRPGSRLLETERKLLTHAIRMSAYNSESTLARLVRPHYSRGDDEARALLREAFTLSGDLQILGNTLHVRLDPASAPRRSKALAALCTELTDTATRYPGTDLTLAYSVKDTPALA
jgi:transposase-like protein